MTTIAKDVAAKLAVASVAVAMILMAFAPSAKAQTTDELQKMINDLLAQVAQLQGQVGQGATGVASGVCPFSWTRDLTSGSTGADVMKLQQFLNADPDTRVSASGAGSVGSETEYFGPATAAAVSKFQVKYRSEVLSPSGLVNPTGYFGPSTRGKANAMCTSAPVDNGGDDNGGDDNGGDDNDAELSGEASLDTFEIDDADDSDVEEGDEEVAVAEITVSFEDGDAEISRLDLAFTDSEGTDSDAWDVFDTISLWVDGDMVAESDASSKSDYLGDEDNGIIRFSGLDIVGMDGEDVVITVAATINDNLATEELGTWDVDAVSMRYFDAEGVAETETGSPVTTDTATFNIRQAGADDEVKVKDSQDDPDATTLLLKDDKKESYVAFAFDLDTDDSTNDIQINDIVITATGTTAIYNYVNDATLLVDGDEVDAADVTVATTSITFEFDDGDFMIDAGDRVTVELEVEFDALDSGEEGDFIQFSLASADVDSEGADDITASGAANGEQHVMITEGIVVLADDFTSSFKTTNDAGDIGEFTLKFDVTSYENDFYIATSGINFTLDEPGAATVSYTLTSTGNEDTADVFTVSDGSTETFTLKVTVSGGTAGSHRVTLDSIDYSTNTDGVTGADTRTLSPAQDFRTDYETIN